MPIRVESGSRFNCAKLNEVFDTALAVLHRRFHDSDEAPSVFFDPSFAEHVD